MTIMVLCQRRTRQKGFETTEAAAPAGRSGNFIGAGPWQRIVTPLSGDGMGADQYLPSDGYPTSYARPEDDAEYRFRRGSGAVCRLGQGKAIGVVGESRRPPERVFDIELQRTVMGQIAPGMPTPTAAATPISCSMVLTSAIIASTVPR